jgi:hypothetical protein
LAYITNHYFYFRYRAFAAEPAGVPVLRYHWEFGDGTSADAAALSHAYTHAGEFSVRLRAEGLDGIVFEKSASVKVEGKINTRFAPEKKQRLTSAP